MAAGSKKKRNPATRLTDDLVVEILSRLPVKSLCRFRCVSKHWRDLISHPDHRKRLPQTLAGFFYHTSSRERFPESARHFTNVTGRGEPLIRPSLSFLPGYADIDMLDCCNGLLLCRSRTTAAGAVRYVVCNPATEEWVALPESSQAGNTCKARLGFDPAVSNHFHVFEFVETDAGEFVFVDGVEIYSSETREWTFRDSGWGHYEMSLYTDSWMKTVFLNGFLHVFESEYHNVLAVDTKGKVWRTIPLPDLLTYYGTLVFIGQSQGHLYYLNTAENDDFEDDYSYSIEVFVLQDYASDEWVLKHSVSPLKFVGMSRFDPVYCPIAIHPECHLIFLISELDHTIRCYDMDRRKVCVIRNMEGQWDCFKRCLPYVPLFLESSAGWN